MNCGMCSIIKTYLHKSNTKIAIGYIQNKHQIWPFLISVLLVSYKTMSKEGKSDVKYGTTPSFELSKTALTSSGNSPK